MPRQTFRLVAFAVLSATIVSIVLAFGPWRTSGGQAFDSARWKSNVEDRDAMLGDLCRDRLQSNLTAKDVRDLLGAPDQDLPRTEVSEPGHQDAHFLYYHLSRQNQSFDSHAFVVVLDVNRKYLRCFVVDN